MINLGIANNWCVLCRKGGRRQEDALFLRGLAEKYNDQVPLGQRVQFIDSRTENRQRARKQPRRAMLSYCGSTVEKFEPATVTSKHARDSYVDMMREIFNHVDDANDLFASAETLKSLHQCETFDSRPYFANLPKCMTFVKCWQVEENVSCQVQ